jgi:serine/threonine protein kinase
MSKIEKKLKKLLRGERACIPGNFLRIPKQRNGKTVLNYGKGVPLSEGQFGATYRGSINANGKRYVAYKEVKIDPRDTTPGAFEFEFKVAQNLKKFSVPDTYLFKSCPIQNKEPKKIRTNNGRVIQPEKRTQAKDILYMELIDGESFHKWFRNTNPSLAAVKSVLAQVFDNLYRIHRKYPTFRHRDLHLGNVMVVETGKKSKYTWKVGDKEFEQENPGVTAYIIDFGLSYWSYRMPNPDTARGGYEHAGIYKDRPGSIYYDTHRFLYSIYRMIRQPANTKERAIKNFIEQLIPKEYLEFNGPYTSNGMLITKKLPKVTNLPTFKDILTHPFLTGEKAPNRPKTLTEALGMIPKAKTPVKAKTPPKPKTKTPSPKLSTAEKERKIKKAAAVLAAKPKPKPPLRRPGVPRPNPVPEIKTATPNASYDEMSPSNIMSLARKVESGRKKAANKLNAKLKEIKATKGKTPTPVRLKQRYTFTDIKGKKREFVRKFAYDRALAKNKAMREERAKLTPRPNPVPEIRTATPTPKAVYKFRNVKGKERIFKSKAWYEKALAKNKAEREKGAHSPISHSTLMRRYERGQPIHMKTPQKVRNVINAAYARFATVTPNAKTPTPNAKTKTPVYKFTNIKGKERVYKSKGWYEKALAKNRAARAAKNNDETLTNLMKKLKV